MTDISEIERFHQAALDFCEIDCEERFQFKSKKHKEQKNLVIKLGPDFNNNDTTNQYERSEAFRMKKFKKVNFKIEHFKPNIAIDTKEIKIKFYGPVQDKVE